MTRLTDAGIVNLKWSEDDDGTVYADGHQSYEIDENCEIAVFRDTKCVEVVEAMDLPHAVTIVLAKEAVCSYNIRKGSDWHGHKVDERGVRI